MQGLFKGMGDVKKRFGNNWEQPGKYIERIENIKIITDRNRKTKVVVNKTVIKVLDNAEGKGHMAGDEITQMIDAHNDAFMPTIKSMICAIMDAQAEDVTEEVCNVVCGVENPDAQPLAGIFVFCDNFHRKTKNGGIFTSINYRRAITPTELRTMLSPEEIERFKIPATDG